MNRKIELLTDRELVGLRKELRTSYFTALTLFLMFMILVHVLIFAKTEKWTIPDYEISLVIGSIIVFYFLTFLFTEEIRREIIEGRKIIEFKTIERKYDFMDKQDRLSAEFRKFVVVASGQEYVVSESQYNEAEVSDYLAVHLTSKRERTIKIELQKAAQPFTNQERLQEWENRLEANGTLKSGLNS